MRKYVLGFLFSENGEQVALIRKNKPEWQAGLHNGIGGKIEYINDPTVPERLWKLEEPIDAMRREFKEETGFEVLDWTQNGIMKGKDWTVWCFVAKGDTTKLKSTTDEKVTVFQADSIIYVEHIINLEWLVPMGQAFVTGKELQYFTISYPNQP